MGCLLECQLQHHQKSGLGRLACFCCICGFSLGSFQKSIPCSSNTEAAALLSCAARVIPHAALQGLSLGRRLLYLLLFLALLAEAG